MSKTNLRQEIAIDALPSKVWKVLTEPDYTSQYFPLENISSNWTGGTFIDIKNRIARREKSKTWVSFRK